MYTNFRHSKLLNVSVVNLCPVLKSAIRLQQFEIPPVPHSLLTLRTNSLPSNPKTISPSSHLDFFTLNH